MGEILIGIGSGGKTCMWIFQESVPQRGAEKPFRSWWRTLEFKDFFPSWSPVEVEQGCLLMGMVQ